MVSAISNGSLPNNKVACHARQRKNSLYPLDKSDLFSYLYFILVCNANLYDSQTVYITEVPLNISVDLKQIEKKAYLSYFEDGLIDLYIGLILTAVGLYMRYHHFPLIFVAWIPLFFFKPVKKWITQPRLGFIVPSEKRKKEMSRKQKITTLVLVMSVMISIVSVLVFARKELFPDGFAESLRQNVFYILGLKFAALIIIGAFVTRVQRLYIYGAILGGSTIFLWFAGMSFMDNLIYPGVIPLICGIVILAKFINSYPLPEKEIVT